MQSHILRKLSSAVVVVAVALFGAVHPALGAGGDSEELVTKAEATLNNFKLDTKMTWIREHLRDAKAVMIAPEVRRAGFVLGGSGGRAVVLARDPVTGDWSQPAFYTLATASIGFQAGIDRSEMVMLVMTEKGLNALLSSQLKLGADVSIAAGPVGKGAAKGITTDVVAFTHSKGIYGGLNLDGTLVKVNSEWNNHYYGKLVTPPDILIRHSVANPSSDKLLQQIAQTAMK